MILKAWTATSMTTDGPALFRSGLVGVNCQQIEFDMQRAPSEASPSVLISGTEVVELSQTVHQWRATLCKQYKLLVSMFVLIKNM